MSASRRRRAGAHAGEAHEAGMERWLLTYADMITLLLALFIVLFALSSINIKKFLEFKLGLTQTFNPSAINEGGSQGLLQQTSLTEQSQSAANVVGPPRTATSLSQLQAIARRIEKTLQQDHLAAAASVTVSARGVVVQVLADKAFFASDSAALGPVGDKVVDVIAGVVRTYQNGLVVEGYTDDEPITGGPYDSNWELSAVRAANVVNRLNVVDKIPSVRLSAQGYGQTDPVATNATPGGRAENRRIDVVVLNGASTSNGTSATTGTSATNGTSATTGASTGDGTSTTNGSSTADGASTTKEVK